MSEASYEERLRSELKECEEQFNSVVQRLKSTENQERILREQAIALQMTYNKLKSILNISDDNTEDKSKSVEENEDNEVQSQSTSEQVDELPDYLK